MAEAFLGRGWSFPPEFDPAAKSVVMREGVDDIRESLRVLISTRLGERVMRPTFGTKINDLLFDSPDASSLASMSADVRNAIVLFESRIEVESVSIEPDDFLEGKILIEVAFRVRSVNSRFNLVFPFYIQEGNRPGL